MPDIDHDLWTEGREASWNAMTPEDKGREFDARLARGDRLARRDPYSSALLDREEARRMFSTGERAFDVFEHGSPVFPLLAGPGSARPVSAAPIPASGGGPRPPAASPPIPNPAPTHSVTPRSAPVAPPTPPRMSLHDRVFAARRAVVEEAMTGRKAAEAPAPRGSRADLGGLSDRVLADRARTVREGKSR
jgi:hypothetical protein